MYSSHSSGSIKLFVSFSHEDENLFEELKKHLSLLQLQGKIGSLFDSKIEPGKQWRQSIVSYINSANVIILLLSTNFFADECCCEIELKQVVKREKVEAVRLLSVILRPHDWQGLIPEKTIILPSNRKPITSWRNKEEAWAAVAKGIREVVEELRQQLDRLWSHPGRSRLPSRWVVPYRYNPLFTGREDVFRQIHDALTASAHILAIHGMNGIGKTQLVIEYASRYQHDYHLVYWIRARSRDLFITDIMTFAQQFSMFNSPKEEKHIDEEQLFTRVSRWLQRNKKWLLILDDLEDFNLLYRLVPAQCSGHVLITTLHHATGPHVQNIRLEPLTIEEGTLFLLSRAKVLTGRISQDAVASQRFQEEAEQIAREVGGHPLALDQAGAYIEETSCSLSQYLDLYHKRRSELLERRGQFSDGHEESVATTLSLVFEKAASYNAHAMDLLSLFAFCQVEAIPNDLIRRGIRISNKSLHMLASDPGALYEALGTLQRFSLLHCHADSGMLSMHPVTQAILQDRYARQKRQLVTLLVRLVHHTFPDMPYNSWDTCERFLPQAQQCARYISSLRITIPEAAALLLRLGRYCYERALYAEAEQHLTSALRLHEQRWGSEHLDTAKNLNVLALLFEKKGATDHAVHFQRRALAIHEQLLGPDNPETATMLNNLGQIYSTRGDYGQAESLLQRALATRERVLPPDHADIAHSLNGLGMLYYDQEKFQQAAPLLQRALKIYEHTYTFDHPDISMTLNNLALVYCEQQHHQIAEQLYLRALDMDERLFGQDHPDVASDLNNLAYLYRAQGLNKNAEEHYRRALLIYEQLFGELHPDTALVLNNLGLLYLGQQDYLQAEPILKRTVAIYEQLPGSTSIDIAASLSNLAELYIYQARLSEAEALLRRAYDICTRKPDIEHTTKIYIIMEKYASLLEKMQKKEEASALRANIRRFREQATHASSEEIS